MAHWNRFRELKRPGAKRRDILPLPVWEEDPPSLRIDSNFPCTDCSFLGPFGYPRTQLKEGTLLTVPEEEEYTKPLLLGVCKPECACRVSVRCVRVLCEHTCVRVYELRCIFVHVCVRKYVFVCVCAHVCKSRARSGREKNGRTAC